MTILIIFLFFLFGLQLVRMETIFQNAENFVYHRTLTFEYDHSSVLLVAIAAKIAGFFLSDYFCCASNYAVLVSVSLKPHQAGICVCCSNYINHFIFTDIMESNHNLVHILRPHIYTVSENRPDKARKYSPIIMCLGYLNTNTHMHACILVNVVSMHTTFLSVCRLVYVNRFSECS